MDRLLKVRDVAKLLNLSISKVYELVETHQIPFYRLGNKSHAPIRFRREDIEKLVKNRRDAKKMAKKIDIFLAQADMMPLIGRRLGAILGPRGKMPKPVPPVGNIKQFIDRAKNVVRVRTKDKPVIHCSIGVEDMNVEDLTANAISVISAVADKLPRGEHNIDSIYLKLTMGPAVKV